MGEKNRYKNEPRVTKKVLATTTHQPITRAMLLTFLNSLDLLLHGS